MQRAEVLPRATRFPGTKGRPSKNHIQAWGPSYPAVKIAKSDAWAKALYSNLGLH